jgi:hypothetical protein
VPREPEPIESNLPVAPLTSHMTDASVELAGHCSNDRIGCSSFYGCIQGQCRPGAHVEVACACIIHSEMQQQGAYYRCTDVQVINSYNEVIIRRFKMGVTF